MIIFDYTNRTYVCPFCNQAQAWSSSNEMRRILDHPHMEDKEIDESQFEIRALKCTNSSCRKYTVIAFNPNTSVQVDIKPEHVYRHFPDYIPEQIRSDYEEASQIIELSPKAAATLLRRCLQGMIRDFWGITRNKLYDEINELKDRISASQWNAIDGLRKLGNIGAHMERDVNLIIDISPDEAKRLMKLIELLLEKWYIARHDEEELLSEIVNTSDEKQAERNTSS